MTAAVSADERFALLSKALSRHAEVTTGRMFGSEGLKVAGKVFALVVKGRLVVKLPATRVETLIDEGAGAHFDPGHGRLLREWIAIEPQADVDWLALAKEAKLYVRSGR